MWIIKKIVSVNLDLVTKLIFISTTTSKLDLYKYIGLTIH